MQSIANYKNKNLLLKYIYYQFSSAVIFIDPNL